MRYTCPRCGWETSLPQDCLHGYCSRCHDWTGEPAMMIRSADRLPWSRPDANPLADIQELMQESMREYYSRPVPLLPGQVELTPGLLLTDTRWVLDRETAESFFFTFDPLAGPWVSSWHPADTLGPFTVSWERSTSLLLQLGREVIERAAVILAAELPLRRLRRHPVLIHVLARMRAVLQQNYHPIASQHADRLYRCAVCGTEFLVPQEHSETVLCGFHSPPERMELVPRPGLGPWEPGSNGAAAQEGAGPGRGALLTEAIAEWEAAQDRARENIAGEMAGLVARRAEIQASLPASAMASLEDQLRAAAGLPPSQGVLDANPDLVLDTQVAARARELEQMPPRPMRAGSHTGDSSAARRGRRPSRHEDPASRRARVLGSAEKMIARLDGEGYGVRGKAERVDAETVSIPELPLFDHDQGGNAARWVPGDPIM